MHRFEPKVRTWSRTWRAAAILAWLLAAALLAAVFPAASKEEINRSTLLPASAPSQMAAVRVRDAFPASSGTPAILVFYNPTGISSADWAAIRRTVRELRTHPVTAQTQVPQLDALPPGAAARFASDDGKVVSFPVLLRADASQDQLNQAVDEIDQDLRRAVGADALNRAPDRPGLHAYVTGPVGIAVDATHLFQHADLALLIATTLLVLALMIVLYRSPILALVPLVSVGIAYTVVSSLLGAWARYGGLTFDAQTLSILTVLLFGAGTDYCLFLIARYRQELRRHGRPIDALRASYKGAAGAILMSGLTVSASLLSLLAARSPSFHEFAIPFSVAVFVMALVAITFVPALIGSLGRAAFWPRIPRYEPDAPDAGQPGRVSRWLGRTAVRRRTPVAVLGSLALAACCLALPHVRTSYDLLSSFPADMPSREGYAVLSAHESPGALAPIDVLVEGGSPEGAVRAVQSLAAVEQVHLVAVRDHAHVALMQVELRTNPYSETAMAALPSIERAAAKGASAGGQAAHVYLAGETAAQEDTRAITARDTRVVIPIVLVAIGLLLLVYLRSVVAPLYLLATIVLSYGAAMGLGWLVIREVLHQPAMQGAIPLYAFVFLVALGEDYNIFVMSRIWEVWHQGRAHAAVERGVADTASVITSAGLILAGTFAMLASLPIQVLLQFGVVTAIGVLLDTFVVRPWMVPAITAILGDAARWPRGT
ncbi:MMPL family transporter [Alicyclobacillus acidocaldarius]|uniref:MMPL domain protein n=1 Tax=Alicyclobacillus acidocaldarius (strain Tc-4-1) TaxID=1048834 RepID=F8IID1_ALIAT|nr:MMPL family transporter [Alicyclobacillus acidocaldarius]AEJ42090.1 MMPL domain protein [Alicyclobacillus acidocaldarius subsp. acidocaldarius Tc-4-1]